MKKIHPLQTLSALATAVLLASCAAPWSGSAQVEPMKAARPGKLNQCSELANNFKHNNTRITAASQITAGTLSVAGQPIEAHCHITGVMHERVSPVDGQSYAIGFEVRLPQNWNGRFLYQANGGLDGFVTTALGPVGGQGALTNALHQGFAVLSSDAGHTRQVTKLLKS